MQKPQIILISHCAYETINLLTNFFLYIKLRILFKGSKKRMRIEKQDENRLFQYEVYILINRFIYFVFPFYLSTIWCFRLFRIFLNNLMNIGAQFQEKKTQKHKVLKSMWCLFGVNLRLKLQTEEPFMNQNKVQSIVEVLLILSHAFQMNYKN